MIKRILLIMLTLSATVLLVLGSSGYLGSEEGCLCPHQCLDCLEDLDDPIKTLFETGIAVENNGVEI